MDEGMSMLGEDGDSAEVYDKDLVSIVSEENVNDRPFYNDIVTSQKDQVDQEINSSGYGGEELDMLLMIDKNFWVNSLALLCNFVTLINIIFEAQIVVQMCLEFIDEDDDTT